MITCTRRIRFAAGHRLYRHGGACENLHGHNYVTEIAFTADILDEVGRVIDFAQIDRIIGGWINRNWDHAFLYHKDDIASARAVTAATEAHEQAERRMKSYVMPYNPTAEGMALYLGEVIIPNLLREECDTLVVVRVVVWETENCCGEWTA